MYSFVSKKKIKSRFVEWTEVEENASVRGLNMSEAEFGSAIGTLHNLGYLLHYNSEHLNNHIMLDVQWMIDCLRVVVTANPKTIGLIKDGWLHHNECDRVWPQCDKSCQKFLLHLLHFFGIAVFTKERKSLVTCRLPPLPIGLKKEQPFGGIEKRVFQFEKEDHVPAELHSCVVASSDLYEYLDLAHCWRDGAVFEDISGDKVLLVTEKRKVLIVGKGGRDVTERITAVMKRLISDKWPSKKKERTLFSFDSFLCRFEVYCTFGVPLLWNYFVQYEES